MGVRAAAARLRQSTPTSDETPAVNVRPDVKEDLQRIRRGTIRPSSKTSDQCVMDASKAPKDLLIAIIKAGLNAVPLVGGSIASLIGDCVTTSTQRAIKKV
jgi:hypothetical protein